MATIEVHAQSKESLVITGVQQILVFSCRLLHLQPGDVLRFDYQFIIDAYTNNILSSQYSDPVHLELYIDEPTVVRSIIVSITDSKRTMEVSSEDRPNALPVN